MRAALRDSHNFHVIPSATSASNRVSSQQPVYPKADGTVSHEKPGIHGVHLDCRFGYGSITFVTAAFGMTAAGRAINKTLKKRLEKPT